jgi:hypothetical protein
LPKKDRRYYLMQEVKIAKEIPESNLNNLKRWGEEGIEF